MYGKCELRQLWLAVHNTVEKLGRELQLNSTVHTTGYVSTSLLYVHNSNQSLRQKMTAEELKKRTTQYSPLYTQTKVSSNSYGLHQQKK